MNLYVNDIWPYSLHRDNPGAAISLARIHGTILSRLFTDDPFRVVWIQFLTIVLTESTQCSGAVESRGAITRAALDCRMRARQTHQTRDSLASRICKLVPKRILVANFFVLSSYKLDAFALDHQAAVATVDR